MEVADCEISLVPTYFYMVSLKEYGVSQITFKLFRALEGFDNEFGIRVYSVVPGAQPLPDSEAYLGLMGVVANLIQLVVETYGVDVQWKSSTMFVLVDVERHRVVVDELGDFLS